MAETEILHQTALHDLWKKMGAQFGAFAGYDMPIRFSEGMVTEHLACRQAAALFDVSHMGQLKICAPLPYAEMVAHVEAFIPNLLRNLSPGACRYSLLLNEQGGIIDDLIFSRPEPEAGVAELNLIVNAGNKAKVLAHLQEKLPAPLQLTENNDHALLAVQGPYARKIIAKSLPRTAQLSFMRCGMDHWQGVPIAVSCSGYTGEDGFEISLPNEMAAEFADRLLKEEGLKPAGLGARDSLRLEAGLPLHGADIDETTTPIEAGLSFAVSKKKLAAGEAYPGFEILHRQLEEGPPRKLAGLKILGRAPARSGVELYIEEDEVNPIGIVTSGLPSPSLSQPIALAYIKAEKAEAGTDIIARIRGKDHPAQICDLPFVPHQYRRKIT